MVHARTAALALALLAPSLARAQPPDDAFCAMLAAIDRGPERIGEVASGTTGATAITLRRDVRAGATHVLIVALSAPATEASMLPPERVGDAAPTREGTRIAHDFEARASGEVTISFRAPPGTAYHAALYRLTAPGRPGLGVSAFARALRAGAGTGYGIGGGTEASERARPPDCRPPLPARLGGARPAPPVLGRLVIRGSMPRADATRALEARLVALTHCADVYGRHDVTLHLVIAATGAVQAASVDGDARLAGCVAREARRWTLPATGAGVTAIDVPIGFAPTP